MLYYWKNSFSVLPLDYLITIFCNVHFLMDGTELKSKAELNRNKVKNGQI